MGEGPFSIQVSLRLISYTRPDGMIFGWASIKSEDRGAEDNRIPLFAALNGRDGLQRGGLQSLGTTVERPQKPFLAQTTPAKAVLGEFENRQKPLREPSAFDKTRQFAAAQQFPQFGNIVAVSIKHIVVL